MQTETKESTSKCLLCEKSVEIGRTFACRRCRKSPFCLDHLDAEYKVCSGCATEERITLCRNLMNQEKGLKGFMRLTQFIFIVAALFFGADKLARDVVPAFLRESIFFEYAVYWGGLAAAGMAFCFTLIASQRQKMKDIEEKIKGHKFSSRYMFR